MLVSIGSVCNHALLASPNKLLSPDISEANKVFPLTHYLVCQYDRLRIRPESIVHGEKEILFVVSQQVNEFEWVDTKLSIPIIRDGVRLSLSVDGKTVTLSNSVGGSHYFDTVLLFLEMTGQYFELHDQIEHLLMLDVQYVGQTVIKENYLRFKKHERLSEIGNDIIDCRPNKELIVKMLSFQRPFTKAMLLPDVPSDDSRLDWYPDGGLIENMPPEHWVNAIEGALIKYFQPFYNKHFKDNYPSDRHTSYSYLYEHDVKSVFVEIHGEYLPHKIGSDSVPYHRIKVIEYKLNDDDGGAFMVDNDSQLEDTLLSFK